jgi:hypothetical protein
MVSDIQKWNRLIVKCPMTALTCFAVSCQGRSQVDIDTSLKISINVERHAFKRCISVQTLGTHSLVSGGQYWFYVIGDSCRWIAFFKSF